MKKKYLRECEISSKSTILICVHLSILEPRSQFLRYYVLVISGGTGTRNPGFEYQQNRGEMSFLYIFAIFHDFSKWRTQKVLRNIEKSSIQYVKNLTKNEEMPCLTSLINPFCDWFRVLERPISGTRFRETIARSDFRKYS